MDKRGLSEIVGYVLLVVIAITLSVLVYGWMKGQLLKPSVKCPEGVSISIEEVSCDKIGGKIEMIVKNTGLFDINGTIVRAAVGDSSKATEQLKMGSMPEIYIPNGLKPNLKEKLFLDYDFSEDISRIEVEPFVMEKKKILLCENAVINQEVSC